MSADSVLLRKSARKGLLKLPSKIHIKIVDAVDAICANPMVGEKLHGVLEGYFKLRVGDYRIVYSFDSKSKTVYVAKIEHRQGVYK